MRNEPVSKDVLCLQDYAAMNSVYDKWVAGMPPTRACIQSKLAFPHLLVEIRVIAVKNQMTGAPPPGNLSEWFFGDGWKVCCILLFVSSHCYLLMK